jgi:hypothetical protein
MSWLRNNYEITAEASRAWDEAKGLALGEQWDEPDDLEEADRDRIDDR